MKTTVVRQHRRILEGLRAELRHRLGLAPAPDAARGGDEADAVIAREARLLHFANLEQLQIRLRAVDDALDRLHAGTFGLCVACEEAIPPARLRHIPEAPRCVVCQTRYEQQRAAIQEIATRRAPSTRIAEQPGDNDGLRRREFVPADQATSDLTETGI